MHKTLLTSAIGAALVNMVALSSAVAQDAAPAELDKMVVTGSLIPRTEIETATPVVTLTAEDMRRQGFRSLADVLRAQPLATGAVQNGQSAGSFTQGAQPISLLGLDPGFTLVLIDGRPMADYPLLYNGESNFNDLSSIPMGMVDRVDIALGNQSAIYGSSAIAGVVNIILKKQADGVELAARVGGFAEGAGRSERVQISGGAKGERARVVYGLQLERQAPIFGYDRADYDSTNDNPDASLRFGSRTFLHLGRNGYIDPGASRCAPLSNLFGGTTQYDQRAGVGNFCGSRAAVGYQSLLSGARSASAYFNASLPVNDSIELYGTVLGHHGRTTFNSGSPVWNETVFNVTARDFQQFGRILSPEETGGVHANDQRNTQIALNAAAGARGYFGGSSWGYDAYFARSQATVNVRRRALLTEPTEAFFEQQFLGRRLGTLAGYAAYAPNINAFYTALTPAQFNAISGVIDSSARSTSDTLNLQLTNTELFELPGGAAGFAAVVQAGQQRWDNPNDARVLDGEFYGLTGTEGRGIRHSHAAAAELRLPLLQTLTANVSGRYDGYRNVGANSDHDLTWKAGLEFRPASSLLLRANYATAFKAADMGYVFSGENGYFISATDYYRCATEEAGTPVGNCSFASEAISGVSTGSKDLRSITAKSWGAGAVFSPTADFNLSVDLYNVEIDDKVEDLDIDTLLRVEAACRTGGQPATSAACVDARARVIRSPANSATPNRLLSVRTNPVNIASEKVRGVMSSAHYRIDSALGQWDLDASYNLTLRHDTQLSPDSAEFDLLDTPLYSTEFRDISSVTVGWEKNAWQASLYGVRYGRTPSYDGRVRKVGAYTQFNGTVGYRVSDNVDLRLSVENLLDANPPRDDSYIAYPFFNTDNYSDFGRSYMLELSWKLGGK